MSIKSERDMFRDLTIRLTRELDEVIISHEQFINQAQHNITRESLGKSLVVEARTALGEIAVTNPKTAGKK